MRQLLLTTSVLCMAASTAPAQVNITFGPDLKPGESTRSQVEVKIEQELVLAGMNVDTNVEQYLTIVETAEEPTSDGTPVVAKFESFILNLTTPVGNLSFDSDNRDGGQAPGELEPVMELLKRLGGASWRTVYDDEHKIVSLDYIDEPFLGLDEALLSEVSPEKYKEQYETERRRYPDAPVNVDDTWTRTERADLGNGQWMKFEKQYTYLGTEEVSGATFDKIGSKALSVEYGVDSSSTLPIKYKDSDLKIGESEGVLLYDREQARFTSIDETINVVGTMNFAIDINGQDQALPGEIDLTFKSKTNLE